ncbi:MAG TPA: glycoside hydrolase family 57 protein [Terriglobales bacterium]|nr:glycoside hydrolase family 57 protein [Terriglobales bacterium]
MSIRVLILWHMHQPFYKDLISGEYRMPWVRMHALKDYYGMVKLLDEFPAVHQTFNVVPSLITQIEDYVAGTARDPFLQVAAKPAGELTPQERRFAVEYLFQANPTHLIGRYPRYAELYDHLRASGDPARAEQQFSVQDFTDLQVLSQLAWFDEFFLEDARVAELVRKERGYSEDDQRFIMERQRELLSCVLPAYREAAKRGAIEISTSPFYHPILPLLCDSNVGAVSSPGLPLPQHRFRHPEDARAQLERGMEVYRRAFGQNARGVWPSEGSVSEEALEIAASVGVQWMATDEGVLARSLGTSFARDAEGVLHQGAAEQLYTIYRYERGGTAMNLLFRDHVLSDLIGFVYSGMEPKEAAQHLAGRIKASAAPLEKRGLQPAVPIILDGENAWEFYPRSGREFLRRLYDVLQTDRAFEALTFSEAIARQRSFGRLETLTPGSWINSNFNVWIGAPEDNRSWDYLHAARQFFGEHQAGATAEKRALAYEELQIAEGSDWNWWYGPEHHSANDRDFDELYRKHLSNIYVALGGTPPEYLAQPISAASARPYFVPQTGYIHPHLASAASRYFDWIGAAVYTADRSGGAMHGGRTYLDAMHAGIDEHNLYVRLDFLGGQPPAEEGVPFAALISVESLPPGSLQASAAVRVQARLAEGGLAGYSAQQGAGQNGNGSGAPMGDELVEVKLRGSLTVCIKLAAIDARLGGKLRLRVSLWRDRLPVDALPLDGSVELDVLSDADLKATAY